MIKNTILKRFLPCSAVHVFALMLVIGIAMIVQPSVAEPPLVIDDYSIGDLQVLEKAVKKGSAEDVERAMVFLFINWRSVNLMYEHWVAANVKEVTGTATLEEDEKPTDRSGTGEFQGPIAADDKPVGNETIGSDIDEPRFVSSLLEMKTTSPDRDDDPGDLNEDGQVTYKDFIIVKMLNNDSEYGDESLRTRADLNGDGEFNNRDVIYMYWKVDCQGDMDGDGELGDYDVDRFNEFVKEYLNTDKDRRPADISSFDIDGDGQLTDTDPLMLRRKLSIVHGEGGF